MKTVWRAAGSIACLIVVAALLQCGSGQKIALLTITTATLPNGTAGTQYSEQVQASGGVAPYTWGLAAGVLPTNLHLQPSNTSTAMISGTPDTPVQADFAVKVTDSANRSASQLYTVSILGLPDTLTISPATLMFNPQLDGTASTTQTATLTNTGSTSIVVNSVVSSGSNSGDFSQTNTCASGLAPGTSCTITVTFTPGQPGPRVASVTINDDTTGTPHQLGLSGIGLTSGINATLSASSLAFSGQAVGTTSPAQTLTLANYGTAALNIASIAATGDFAQNNACGANLASAARCPINVTFTPSAMGGLTGTLSVTDNQTGNPQTVSLAGTGVSIHGTLTGECYGTPQDNPAQCQTAQALTACPPGVVAKNPAHLFLSCSGDSTQPEDGARSCAGKNRFTTVVGYCLVNP